MLRKITMVLGVLSIVCSLANATQKVSSNFSIGVGMEFIKFADDGVTGIFEWTTNESIAVNTSQRQGEFSFIPTVSGVTGTGGGWTFPNRVPTDNGVRGGFGYDDPANPWQMVLHASYNGDKGTGGKITVNITSISIYGSDWGTGASTMWFTETTPGHEAIGPSVTTLPYTIHTDPACCRKIIWNPADFAVNGESSMRTFGFDFANALYGCMFLDGFEITGNVVYEYNEPIIPDAPKDSNDFDYKWEADSVPTPIWGNIDYWIANEDGTVTIVQDYENGLAGWNDLDLPKWTVETRLRVDAPKEELSGVFNIDIEDGNDMYCLIIDSGRLVDAYNASNIYSNVLLTGGFHTIRIAKHGNGNQNIYVDSRPISFALTPIPYTGARIIGCGDSAGGVTTGTVTVDYFRLDTTGAFAPIDMITPEVRPVIPAANSFSDSMGLVAFSFFGPVDKYLLTGSSLWRGNYLWQWYEPTSQGVYDFTGDNILPAVELYDQTPICILGGENSLYSGYNAANMIPIDPAQRAGFNNFAAQVATRYKNKPVIYELGNEPDGAGGPTAAQYVTWASGVSAAMRAVDPNVVIAGPAAHIYATSWITSAFNAGLLNYLDVVTIHLYLDSPQPAPEENATRVANFKALVASYKPNMPIACSEWGYRRYIDPNQFLPPEIANNVGTVTATQQRNYLPRAYMLTQLWGLRFHVNFCWNLNMNSAEAGYGLMNADVTSPAYDAMVNMKNQLPNANFVQRIAVGSPDDYVLEFSTSKGTRWAVWTKGADHNVSFTVPSNDMMSVVNIVGSQTTHITPSANLITIQASEAVQYLHKAKLLNFDELAEFAAFWQATDCASKNNCDGYDYEPDGNVDLADLESFCSEWLTPVD